MIDSTNPRIMATNIRELGARPAGTSVEGNPSGSGYTTLLTKLKVGTNKYKLPADVKANPEGEASGSLNKIGIGSGIYSVGGGSSAYSTTEAVVGKWIDGSDVYEKTYFVAAPTKGSNQTIEDSDLEDADIVISLTGTYKRYVDSSTVMTYAMNSSESGGDSSFLRVEMPAGGKTGVLYKISTANTAQDLVIVIRYTKKSES